MLRVGLGRLIGVVPHRIRFARGPAGKPYLLEPSFARSLRFNLAHSDGFAVFAATVGREVGIDVERVHEHPDLFAVAAGCFSPYEQATLTATPLPDRTAAFYRCWTRKEAYVKAIGAGLQAKLDDFDVGFAADDPPALRRVAWQLSEPTHWRMEALNLPPGYIGAVVYRRGSPITDTVNEIQEWT
ncbi:MAG: 4'-phosphopantetheinyl transferase superfamily protein [Solirubrobacterales bacterium]|nr:4'-phosphopantetheinyl transferase superfamily protein [Solirubrobacterales bacterium]